MSKQYKKRKVLTFPLRLSIIVLILGALFKIMHWPYAKQLMLIGSVAILALYSIRFLYKNPKERLDYIKFGFVVLWIFSYFNYAFHLLNLSYVFEIILILLFFWWLIEEGLMYFVNRKLKNNKILKTFYYTLIIITTLFVIFGMLFKLMHWPYGNVSFTLGILLLSLTLIIDCFAVKK